MTTFRLASASLALAVAGVLATPVTAAAESYQPPQLAFVATGEDAITATITNPNSSGVCWAVIAVDGSVHEFAEHNPAGTASAGATIHPVRSGLAAGRYRLSGFCGTSHTSPDQVRGADYTVDVPATKPSTGSAGL
ncbi:hypothetical protein [Nocardia sp. NPDC003183]